MKSSVTQRPCAFADGADFTAARSIQKTLGTRRAAGFLRNRGFSLATALLELVGHDAAIRYGKARAAQ